MLGNNLKLARELKGMTQQEVADIVGTNRVVYARFENGAKIPSVPMLVLIANVLECSLDNLLEEEIQNYH